MEDRLIFIIFLVIVSVVSSHPSRNSERISARMCQTYKDLVPKISQQTMCYSGQKCGEIMIYQCKTTSTGLIVGGVQAHPGEFPHMAAIGWKNENGGVDFPCGGSLISDKFVLTVAHCKIYQRKTPSIVRLGEQNLATTDDGAQPVDYNIKEFTNHPDYNKYSKTNDIALIELENTVTFNKFIRPACLKQTNQLPRRVIATGWGQNGTFENQTDELMKVVLKTVANDICNIEYEDEYSIESTHLCAGMTGKDTCRGDSGGPVQIGHSDAICVYDIVGLTSFGKFYCGLGAPGVYTRVSSYLDWIEGIVWPGK